MKKIIAITLTLVMLVAMAACGGEATVTTSAEKEVSVGSIEELELLIEEDVADTTSALNTECQELVEEISTFEAYQKNVDKVQAFYDKILAENRELGIRMREYSVAYAELIMDSAATNDEREDAIDSMYDTIYDDAWGDVYDAIYDDLMGDMYDAFYDGVVSDGYDYVAYDRWYDMSSEAYDMWSDCGSDIYDEWSDCGSDVYDFWSDVYGAMWDGDDAEIQEEIEEFQADIKAMREAGDE